MTTDDRQTDRKKAIALPLVHARRIIMAIMAMTGSPGLNIMQVGDLQKHVFN